MWERLVYQLPTLAQVPHFAFIVFAGYWTNRKGFHRAKIIPVRWKPVIEVPDDSRRRLG